MSYLVPPTTTATRAPIVTDDAGDGYRIGWIWVDTAARAVYMLADATAGAAVWLQVGVSLFLLMSASATDREEYRPSVTAAFSPDDTRVN